MNTIPDSKITSEILTAGPGGPAAPVSPSFPGRPCLQRRIQITKRNVLTESEESICYDWRRIFLEKIYSLSDQYDPQDPSLLPFQAHPEEERIIKWFVESCISFDYCTVKDRCDVSRWHRSICGCIVAIYYDIFCIIATTPLTLPLLVNVFHSCELTLAPFGPGNPITPGCPRAPWGPGGPGRPSSPGVPCHRHKVKKLLNQHWDLQVIKHQTGRWLCYMQKDDDSSVQEVNKFPSPRYIAVVAYSMSGSEPGRKTSSGLSWMDSINLHCKWGLNK